LNAHLPAVHYYLAQHALRAPPYLPYAYYPQAAEVLMTLGAALGGEAAAQLFAFLFFPLAALLLYRIGRTCGLDRFAALAGLLFTISVPFMHWTGVSGKNDFALAFYILGALLAYLRWTRTRVFAWIVVGTFLLSMGAGIKHVILFALPPIVLLYSYAAWKQPRRMRAFALLLAIFALFGLMWHIRTWLATGNPLYPAAAVTAVTSGMPHHNSVWRDIIAPVVRFPWETHFRGHRYFESVSDYPMGIALIVFAPMWLLVRKPSSKEGRVCLQFCAAYFAYWFVTVGMLRYAIAPIAVIVLFTAGRAVEYYRSAGASLRASVVLATFYALIFSACGVAILEVNIPELRYFAGRIGKQEYLREALTTYGSLEFLRTVVRSGDATLAVNNCSLAYTPDESAFDCVFVPPANWQPASAILDKKYRFLILPRPTAAPPGWRELHADAAFRVYAHTQN